MNALVVVLALLGVPAMVFSDLFSDVPRVATWIAARAERLLRPHERPFYGWAGEISQAAEDAAAGRRSRISVLAMAFGIYASAIRQRFGNRKVARAVTWAQSIDSAKIWFPIADSEGGMTAETVWATWVGQDEDGEDLYRIDNHIWFSELACFGDTVRTTFEPIDDRPGYGTLSFAAVVQQSSDVEVSLWSNWKVLPKRRLRRLHRHLTELEMRSEWAAPQLGRGTLPPNDVKREKALQTLRRRRVQWEVVERTSPLDPNDPDPISKTTASAPAVRSPGQ
jgi:hypothetical protein